MNLDRATDLDREDSVFRLLREALELPSAERETFVGQTAGDDGPLRERVLSLLRRDSDDWVAADRPADVRLTMDGGGPRRIVGTTLSAGTLLDDFRLRCAADGQHDHTEQEYGNKTELRSNSHRRPPRPPLRPP